MTQTRRVAHRILGTGVALFVCLLPARASVLGFSRAWVLRPLDRAPYVALGAYHDFVFVGLLTLVFAYAAWGLRKHPRLQRCLATAFACVAVISLAAAAANVPFVRLIGRPFNYQWFYYSDFLQGFDARNAILANVTPSTALVLASACCAMLVVGAAIARGLDAFEARPNASRPLAVLAALAVASYLTAGHAYVHRGTRPAEIYENPVVAFAQSFLARDRQPGIFTMPTRFAPDDLLPVSLRQTSSTGARRFSGRIDNVVMVVLESVAAEYVETFGGKYPVTPTLARYRDRSALIHGVYAHAPHSNTSLWSLLTGLYPWVTYRFVARDYPEAELPAISSELAKRGYRTAFFNSADNRFQNIGGFLVHHGFEKTEDWRSMRSDEPLLKVVAEDWPYQDGIPDSATVRHLVRWIDEAPDRRFFAMMWSMMTHYPYFATGKLERYVADDEDFNRYLNGLRETDAAIGQLLAALESRGLAERTLVVVVGDHGESFQQHGVGGHGADLYDESIRIPLQLINPVLFHAEEHDGIGGLVDVPATILDVLGIPLPGTWQGRSLLGAERSPRVYFFAPTSDYWFGYREGDRKCLYNASREIIEIYELTGDAAERDDRAKGDSSSARTCKERLAAWVQFQNSYVAGLVSSR